MKKFNGLTSLIVLLMGMVLSIACGGGGGGIDGTGDSITDTGSSLVNVVGKADFSSLSAKSRQQSQSSGEIVMRNVVTGEEFKVALNADGSYQLDVSKGTYVSTATSSTGQVIKLVLPDVQANVESANIDVNTTTVSVYVESLVTTSLTEFNTADLKSKVLEVEQALGSANDTLTNGQSNSQNRMLAIGLLSISESVRSLNNSGSSASLLSITEIKTKVTAETVLQTHIATAVKRVITVTNKSVSVPTSSGELVLSNVTEVETNVTIIQQVSVSVTQLNNSISGVNNAPVAKAPAVLQIGLSQSFFLDGTKSFDIEGDTITYAWTQISGNGVTIQNAATASANIVAPSFAATLRFELKVTDAKGASSTTQVEVQVSNSFTNHAPVADAGASQVVLPGAEVILDASASSDTDGDTLSYQWEQLSGQSVTLINSFLKKSKFKAPTQELVLSFKVTVSDGITSSSSTVQVEVLKQPQQRRPVVFEQKSQSASYEVRVLRGLGEFKSSSFTIINQEN